MTDQNLSSLISAAVAAKMTPEFIEKEVDTRVGKLVVETIDKALRSYGDVAKLIETAVTDALKVDRLDLPSYGAMVTDMLKAQIAANVAPVVAGRLAQDMEELLKLAPKEVKLSQIATQMLEHHDRDGWGNLITVIVERTKYKSCWLYLDDEEHREDRDKYRCKFRVLVSEDGTITGAYIAGSDFKEPSGFNAQWIGHSHGLSQRLRAYVACGTKIVLDEDHVVISHGDY